MAVAGSWNGAPYPGGIRLFLGHLVPDPLRLSKRHRRTPQRSRSPTRKPMMPSIDPSRSLEHRLRLRAGQLRREIATVRGDLRAQQRARSAIPRMQPTRKFKASSPTRKWNAISPSCAVAPDRPDTAALRRIDDGSYGICHDCGNPIDPRRVLAQPTALRCVECQTIAEGATTRVPNGHVGPRP